VAGGKQPARHLVRAAHEIGRLIVRDDRVIVDDAKERLVLRLQRDPILDRTEVISNMQFAGRLNTAEDSWHPLNLGLGE
jgi:hypothetical protein